MCICESLTCNFLEYFYNNSGIEEFKEAINSYDKLYKIVKDHIDYKKDGDRYFLISKICKNSMKNGKFETIVYDVINDANNKNQIQDIKSKMILNLEF